MSNLDRFEKFSIQDGKAPAVEYIAEAENSTVEFHDAEAVRTTCRYAYMNSDSWKQIVEAADFMHDDFGNPDNQGSNMGAYCGYIRPAMAEHSIWIAQCPHSSSEHFKTRAYTRLAAETLHTIDTGREQAHLKALFILYPHVQYGSNFATGTFEPLQTELLDSWNLQSSIFPFMRFADFNWLKESAACMAIRPEINGR